MIVRQGKPYQLPERPCETCQRSNKEQASCSQYVSGQQWPGCMRWVDWFLRCWQMARGEAPEAGREGG